LARSEFPEFLLSESLFARLWKVEKTNFCHFHWRVGKITNFQSCGDSGNFSDEIIHSKRTQSTNENSESFFNCILEKFTSGEVVWKSEKAASDFPHDHLSTGDSARRVGMTYTTQSLYKHSGSFHLSSDPAFRLP
jgi:hypothetical protein